MMLTLKPYQERCLNDLAGYLESASTEGGKRAFVLQTNHPYHEVPQLPGLPYVCLRVPTGGGKTLMAAHAVGIAAEKLLRTERAFCLWLVPSNAILDQTIKALRDRSHPYRQALASRFSSDVRVLDVAEALALSRADAEGAACVLVATLQAFRVEATEGRKVYEEAGVLMSHFSGLDAETEGRLEKGAGDRPVPSLCNILRLHRPIVVVDEAHNARTPLSFETLARFSPSCILEFTATPQTHDAPAKALVASNLLCAVSARELKADGMVKLPIHLRNWADWREAVADALQMQKELEALAAEESRETGEVLRPIVLFQAQRANRNQVTLTPPELKKRLMEDFRVREEQIAIATGETRELEGVDLRDPAQPIRFIITQRALAEGWDCPFAYILCSVAELGTAQAVEQILGRVLRLPGATPKRRPELNRAYAFVTSPRFAEAAKNLRDALVENGFEKMEAEDLVGTFEEPRLPLTGGSLFGPQGETVSRAPALDNLPEDLRGKIAFDPDTKTIQLPAALDAKEAEALEAAFDKDEDRQAVRRLYAAKKARVSAKEEEAARAPFIIPALAVRTGGQLHLFDEEPLLEVPFDLAASSPEIPEALFAGQGMRTAEDAVIDVQENGHLQIDFQQELHAHMDNLWNEPDWTVAALAGWLDRHVKHLDIGQGPFALFAHQVVTYLVDHKSWEIGALGRQRFRLAAALQNYVASMRACHRQKVYQGFLFGDGKARLEVSPEVVFSLTEAQYAPFEIQRGVHFAKHAFSCVGSMNTLELGCARYLEMSPQVKRWVRNIERRPDSFWLQTATDRFYPDFLAELNDGRMLAIEAKGEDRWSNDDSKEKRAIGELWAERSNGKCLFAMPKGPDWPAIEAVMQSRKN
jgi:type III restriction enzyme